MSDELVKLKGTVNGVNMIISETDSIMDILEALRMKIKTYSGFFKGPCNVFVCGREFSNSDKLRITSVMKTVFPEAVLVFDSDENPADEYEINIPEEKEENEAFLEKTAENRVYADKKICFYQGNVQSGEELFSEGDVFLCGNVEEGAKIISAGSIYIIGRLSGSAYAGILGDENATVTASVFEAEAVEINRKKTSSGEFSGKNTPETAYLMNGTIFFKKIL